VLEKQVAREKGEIRKLWTFNPVFLKRLRLGRGGEGAEKCKGKTTNLLPQEGKKAE